MIKKDGWEERPHTRYRSTAVGLWEAKINGSANKRKFGFLKEIIRVTWSHPIVCLNTFIYAWYPYLHIQTWPLLWAPNSYIQLLTWASTSFSHPEFHSPSRLPYILCWHHNCDLLRNHVWLWTLSHCVFPGPSPPSWPHIEPTSESDSILNYILKWTFVTTSHSSSPWLVISHPEEHGSLPTECLFSCLSWLSVVHCPNSSQWSINVSASSHS